MRNRRDFVRHATVAGAGIIALQAVGCGSAETPSTLSEGEDDLLLYDTYAMALYFDGGLGPRTGVIKAEDILRGEALDMEFWHGHGGRSHRFAVSPEQLEAMKTAKVFLETDSVQSPSHRLFVDFTDPQWRVPGAEPVRVPRGDARKR